MPPLDLGLSETTFADLDHGMDLLFRGLETGFDHGMDFAAKATHEVSSVGLSTISTGLTALAGVAASTFNLAAPNVTAPKIGFVPTPAFSNAYTV